MKTPKTCEFHILRIIYITLFIIALCQIVYVCVNLNNKTEIISDYFNNLEQDVIEFNSSKHHHLSYDDSIKEIKPDHIKNKNLKKNIK